MFGFISGVRTEYMLGRNTRKEMRNGQNNRFGSRRAIIRNYDLHYAYDLDLDAKVYTAVRIDDRGLPADPLPTSVKWQPSDRTRTIHIETADTGERRKMFGYTARHIKARHTETTSPPGDSSQTDYEVDGWLIEPRGWQQLHPARPGVVYAAMEGEGETIHATSEGPAANGLAVVRSIGPSYERVVQLSEHPLDPALFEPPSDFKLVQELSPVTFDHQYGWGMRVKLFTLMLTDGL
jgi:hypothetical protein